MRKFFYFSAILLIVSCNSSKNATTSSPKELFVEDLLVMNSEEIQNLFPSESITEDVGLLPEGNEKRAFTVIFPNTPDEINITWKEMNRNQIDDIRLNTNGKWKSRTGIQIGTTYDELTNMNKKPISFYGFGWDYSGAVQWNEGKLEKSKVFVFLASDREPKNKFYGDQIVKATAEEIKEMNLKVKAILFKS